LIIFREAPAVCDCRLRDSPPLNARQILGGDGDSHGGGGGVGGAV